MRRQPTALLSLGVLGLVAAVATGTGVLPIGAADHLDAPGLTSPGDDGRIDIADLFVFGGPKPNKTVLAMTVSPAVDVFSPDSFHPDADYIFNIDVDGDGKPEQNWKFRFGPVRDNGSQLLRARGPNGAKVLGRVGTANQTDGVRVFAGRTDDPFFFDLNAFLGSDGRSFCDGGESDFFAGLDVLSIVLQVPTEMIAPEGTALGVWVSTEVGGQQIDRQGIPALNTVFIPSDRKNDYNVGVPVDDPAAFGEFFGELAGVLLPDQLPYTSTLPSGFLNGRTLSDDVIDIELGIITGDPTAGDCVDANDVVFSENFPYLAQPHSGARFSYMSDEGE